MAVDSTNVDVALTGAMSKAPLGTAAPTDATTALPGTWADLGYFSEDGVTENTERDSNEIGAWQNGVIVRTVYTKGKVTYGGTLIETKVETVETYYGSEFNEVEGSIEVTPTDTGGMSEYVIDYIDGDKYVRAFLPLAEVTERGEVPISGTDAVGMEITVTGYYSPTHGYSMKKFYSALKA